MNEISRYDPEKTTADDVPSTYEVEIAVHAMTDRKVVRLDGFSTVLLKVLGGGEPDTVEHFHDNIFAVWKVRGVPHNGRIS